MKDLTCAQRSLEKDTRIPEMFDLGKFHNGNFNPPPFRLLALVTG